MAAWGTTPYAVRPGGLGAVACPERFMNRGDPHSRRNRTGQRGSSPGPGLRRDTASPVPPSCRMAMRTSGRTSAGTKSSEAAGMLSCASSAGYFTERQASPRPAAHYSSSSPGGCQSFFGSAFRQRLLLRGSSPWSASAASRSPLVVILVPAGWSRGTARSLVG